MVEDDPEAADLATAYLTADGSDAFRVEWSSNLFRAMYRVNGRRRLNPFRPVRHRLMYKD